MNHLRSCIRLLVVIGEGYRVELRRRVIAAEDAGGVFPSDGRACLDLRPREARVLVGDTAFGNKIIDSALAVLVSRVPVLDSRILDFCTVVDIYLDHSGMQLILVAHWSRTAFEI